MIAVNFFAWFLFFFREEGSIKSEMSMYNNRLKQNSKEQMDLWIQEEARRNPQEMLFSKIPANKLGTFCAIFYCCETNRRKVQFILKFKFYLTAVAFFLMKRNYRSRSLRIPGGLVNKKY